MLTSAPFDNWWHNAYGLDVKIISPPHALLILGIRAIDLGMLFLMLAAMNRASDAGDANFKSLQRLFLYLGGLVLGGQMFFIMEYTWDVTLHRVIAYICLAIAVPVVLATISQASRFRWAATTISAIYIAFADCVHSDLSALSCAAQTGAGLLSGHAPRSAEVSDSADRTGTCTGSALAAYEELEAVADCTGVRSHFCRCDLRRGVAVCEFPPLPCERKPILRDNLLRLQLEAGWL